ncbi:hypothetical protein SynSYN20_00426 [Synechococcus sp. SYN20]|nr:hypothetical protein SynSYN20_00426 [Synechococcus sp. SYN20]
MKKVHLVTALEWVRHSHFITAKQKQKAHTILLNGPKIRPSNYWS